MRLLYKCIAPKQFVNANGSVAGGWTFSIMDQSAYTIASEDWLSKYPEVSALTASAEIKYLCPMFPDDYIEVWGDYLDISPAKWTVHTKCFVRSLKSTEWEVGAEGIFNFVQTDLNRKIVRIPKEVVNEIKG